MVIIKTLDDVEKLILLMKKHRVDFAEVNGIRLTITRHEIQTGTPASLETRKKPLTPEEAAEQEDRLLFYSSNRR